LIDGPGCTNEHFRRGDRAERSREDGCTGSAVAPTGQADGGLFRRGGLGVSGGDRTPRARGSDSASLARRDLEQACEFAFTHGISLQVVATEELDNPEYAKNDANRCFHCKDELFTTMKLLGEKLSYSAIAYGMNADDTRDYRPGQRAAQQHQVLAPLAEAGLTKAEVRVLSKAAGYSLWDRPAAPCLSSRVEYGRKVTREVLEQVENAEESMRQLGFREFRVRHHGELARVEIARNELPAALTMSMLDAITAALKQAGYQYVTLDTTGFRSGSLNAILPVEILARRGA
jgi:pyridinium-3,5-biscarboxylic acid mononucleotide sulfurtransferase